MRSFFVAGLALFSIAGSCAAQNTDFTAMTCGPAHTGRQNPAQPKSQPQTGQSQLPNAPTPAGVPARPRPSQQQPKRILGLMPNYRAITAGEIPVPPSPKEAFRIATQNSFDYSSFVFVGLTSLIAEAGNSHPALGKGVKGYWGYSWRGFVDKTDGNYWVIFALPTVLHEDERYYAKGQGGIFDRAVYASTRIVITPSYRGNNTFNGSEILGRGISQTISLSYYPNSDRTVSGFAQKYAWALGRDALTNTFREFWPDISDHLLHHPPKAQ